MVFEDRNRKNLENLPTFYGFKKHVVIKGS